jgi:hypothetical protein
MVCEYLAGYSFIATFIAAFALFAGRFSLCAIQFSVCKPPVRGCCHLGVNDNAI